MSAPITEALVSAINRLLVRLDVRGVSANEIVACIKPLIADSEARAVAQWSGGLDQSLPDLYEAAKSERDQLRDLLTEWKVSAHIKGEAIDSLLLECDRLRAELSQACVARDATCIRLSGELRNARAETERLTAQRENLLKPMRDRAIARAERAEAELAAAKLLLNEETDCAEVVEAAIVRQYARAERAEAEVERLNIIHADAIAYANGNPAFQGYCDKLRARAERAELEVAALKQSVESGQRVLREDAERNAARAERAEAELDQVACARTDGILRESDLECRLNMERARLDHIINSYPEGNPFRISRDKIDAAMKEGK
jgi:hypothetical protein